MENWLPTSTPDFSHACQLYCFPHAGGGSAIYHRWERLLPETVQVRPVKLPGRESRFREAAIDNMPELVNKLIAHVAPTIRPPFALYGHSMGGLIAFEFAQALRSQSLRPNALFVSASRAPHLTHSNDPLHAKPDDKMIRSLVEDYGRGSPATAEELQMMEMMTDTIRADLKLLETYQYSDVEPLECSLVALAGSEDKMVNAAQVNAWRQHTTGRFAFRTLPGHHFFLRDQESAIVRLITGKLAR